MTDPNSTKSMKSSADDSPVPAFAPQHESQSLPLLSTVGLPLATTTALGWYLSLGFHVAGYGIAASAFTWLGLHLNLEQPGIEMPPIQASLGEEDRIDDLPVLEIIPTAGPDTQETTQSLQQIAKQIALADRGQIDTIVSDAKMTAVGSAAKDAGQEGESPFFRIPESGLAVTKGSFTAWTDPANPQPGQLYQIIIEIRLPDRVKSYRLSDLSGIVIGSDSYRQHLPFDRDSPSAARVTGGAEYETVRRNTRIEVIGKTLQLAIKVPGAERLVRDRIRIKSRRLKEEQEITLVFGSSRKPLGLGLGKDKEIEK